MQRSIFFLKISLTPPKRMVKSSGFIDGPVAQLGARVNRTDEVAGSNPARSTCVDGRNLCGKILFAQRKRGPMAQLGARLNGIEKVVGSSPTRSTGLIKESATC